MKRNVVTGEKPGYNVDWAVAYEVRDVDPVDVSADAGTQRPGKGLTSGRAVALGVLFFLLLVAGVAVGMQLVDEPQPIYAAAYETAGVDDPQPPAVVAATSQPAVDATPKRVVTTDVPKGPTPRGGGDAVAADQTPRSHRGAAGPRGEDIEASRAAAEAKAKADAKALADAKAKADAEAEAEAKKRKAEALAKAKADAEKTQAELVAQEEARAERKRQADLAAAKAAVAAGQWAEAKTLLDGINSTDPQVAALRNKVALGQHMAMAQTEMLRGNYAAAQVQLRAARGLAPAGGQEMREIDALIARIDSLLEPATPVVVSVPSSPPTSGSYNYTPVYTPSVVGTWWPQRYGTVGPRRYYHGPRPRTSYEYRGSYRRYPYVGPSGATNPTPHRMPSSGGTFRVRGRR